MDLGQMPLVLLVDQSRCSIGVLGEDVRKPMDFGGFVVV
jgi:hypothetical protein